MSLYTTPPKAYSIQWLGVTHADAHTQEIKGAISDSGASSKSKYNPTF